MNNFALLPVPLFAVALVAGSVQTPEPEDPKPGMTQAELDRLIAEISEDVADLRELDWKFPVKASLANRETVRKYLYERLVVMTTPEELARFEFAVQLIGLLPAG